MAVALAAALLAASNAAAQGEIRSLRIGRHAEYDRLVFELGSQPVDVVQAEGTGFELDFAAPPPLMSREMERKLSALGIAVTPASGGTRVVIDPRGRQYAAFRLPVDVSVPGQSERIVLDFGKGTTAPSVPANAVAVPVGRIQMAANESSPPAPQTPAVPAIPQTPPVETRPPDSAAAPRAPSGSERVWVRMSGIQFEGLPEGAPTQDELLALELNVSTAENGDLTAQRDELPVQKIRLGELTSGERASHRVGGSLLQEIVEKVADAYEDRGKYGTRIDIRTEDLQRLMKDDAGPLKIYVSEATPPAK